MLFILTLAITIFASILVLLHLYSMNMNISNKTSKVNLKLSWLIWGLAATFFFTDYMARVAPSVMHKFLQVDFGINEVGFATLTSFFYVPYILMQIPVGLTVDRIKIRYLLTTMSILTALGCYIFGAAQNLETAAFARLVIGFSAAFAFTSALRLATAWFPPYMLGLLAGLTQAVGMLGASAGQAPLSYLISGVGWRNSMYVIGIIFLVLALLIFIYVQDSPIIKRKSSENLLSKKYNILKSLKTVLSNKQTWINALYAGFLYGPSAVIGESLGPAYLQFGRGLSQHASAFAISLIFIGWVFGGPALGILSDKIGRRKPCLIISAIFGFIFTTIFVFCPKLSTGMTYMVFLGYGLTNTGVGIAYAVATEINNKWVLGTAIAFTNMLSIFVGALLQPLVGFMMDKIAEGRGYNIETLLLSDFQYALKILPISSLIALILAFFVKETYCKPLEVS